MIHYLFDAFRACQVSIVLQVAILLLSYLDIGLKNSIESSGVPALRRLVPVQISPNSSSRSD